MPSEKTGDNFRKVSWARILSWVLLSLYTAVVYQGSILTPNRIPPFFSKFDDKSSHGILYFLLWAAAFLAFRNAKQLFLNRYPGIAGMVYCALIGVLTEGSQLFVRGRSCDVHDWLANMAGAGAGMLLLILLRGGKILS